MKLKTIVSIFLLAISATLLPLTGADNIRKRLLPEPVILGQAQLKYPLNTLQTNYSYYTRWTDWPLFLNSAPAGKNFFTVLSDQDYIFICKTMKKYGMDGFSAVVPSKKKIGRSFPLWDTFARLYPQSKLVPMWNPHSQPESVRLALDSPAVMKINGKVPLLFYAAYPEAKRKKLVAELRKMYPGQLLLLLTDGTYSSSLEGKFNRGAITPRDIAQLKDNLRRVLRDGDGFYFSRRPRNAPENGVLHLKFYEYMVRQISEVMAEPEFKDKLMVLTAGVEHSNSYNIGYSLVTDGTATLRGFMDVALKYNADIINIPEWDEQNENSSLRPTVFKGLSLMRLMRHYAVQMGKLANAALPGDNSSLPNMIVSFRKMLIYGEKFKLELLHLPERGKSQLYEVQVSLKSADGRNIHTFAPVKMGGEKLQVCNLVVPTEKFSGELLLHPELVIRQKDTQWRSSDFGAAELRPTAINDYEEFHLGIRDIVKPEKAEFSASVRPDKQVEVSGKFVFKENIRNLELLENGRCIYSYTAPGQPSWRNDREYAVLEISLMSALRQIRCSGELTISSPGAQWKIAQVVNPGLKISNNRLWFRNINLSNWEGRAVAAIPAKELASCKIKVSIPGFCEQEFAFADLLARENYAIYGKDGFILSFNRQNRQTVHPAPQDRKEFEVSTLITPERPDSVLIFQAHTPEGRQFRSKPLSLYSAGNAPVRNAYFYSDDTAQPVKLQISGDRIPEINYIFTDRHGSSLPAAAGRHFWASRGGYTLHSTGKGGGATSLYGIGNIPANRNYPVNARCGMPELRTGSSGSLLCFDGIGNFITLPQGVIGRRNGWSVKIKLCPDKDFSGNCMLFGSMTCRSTHAGLRLYLRNGKIAFEFMNKYLKCVWRDTGIKLPNGKWSELKVSWDLENLIFELDGKIAGKFDCKGPAVFDALAVFGGSGSGKDYFKGKISHLSVTPYL